SYLRNPAYKVDGVNHETSAALTGQATHQGVTIQADIVKQKLPEQNGGFKALNANGVTYGKSDDRMYTKLTTYLPIDLTRFLVANGYMGRIGLINSGGASSGESDLSEAVKTAGVNKRAGGMGLISGRKAFQRPMSEGIQLLNAIQDVYRCSGVTVA
ncbi:MAG: fructose-bisphosphate aldolase, partial [Chloroflexi bacterium]|nr:fructose-bisphosphate aldolase [Chloroflexota bacterium]